MDKLWAGKSASELDALTDKFNRSLPFDKAMFKEDITGSLAHAAMLCANGIIGEAEFVKITSGLKEILSDIESGKLTFDGGEEDIHSFVELTLTSRIGEAGKVLHTARSRNDQVALDLRMKLRNESETIKKLLVKLVCAFVDKAEETSDYVATGYTHLQRAQPICFGHQLMAYANMFLRDIERLDDCVKRINVSPLGSCALGGTTYPIDRFATAEALGFSRPCSNSIDGVSDRDFVAELAFVNSLIMTHLSRFSEEYILWSSFEFKYVDLDERFSTGSSIMPQKKNPDVAELVRGKTGRVYGSLISMLTVLKGLPLAYNKDMQEDKEGIFDSVETVKICLEITAEMLSVTVFNRDAMYKAASGGYINATDVADFLVTKGLEFRNAYKITGKIVRDSISKGKTLEMLSLDEYKEYSPLFDEGIFEAIDLTKCVRDRTSYGAAGFDSVKKQIEEMREILSKI
jgi:argininosuccinate lyase